MGKDGGKGVKTKRTGGLDGPKSGIFMREVSAQEFRVEGNEKNTH